MYTVESEREREGDGWGERRRKIEEVGSKDRKRQEKKEQKRSTFSGSGDGFVFLVLACKRERRQTGREEKSCSFVPGVSGSGSLLASPMDGGLVSGLALAFSILSSAKKKGNQELLVLVKSRCPRGKGRSLQQLPGLARA